MDYVRVLVQILDFMVKAAVHFQSTAEGKKEWADIENAFNQAEKRSQS